jgi:hypothetical protein
VEHDIADVRLPVILQRELRQSGPLNPLRPRGIVRALRNPSSRRSCHVCESRAEGERRQVRDDGTKAANSAGQSGAGFLPYPLLRGFKGGEKSSIGNPAGPTQRITPGEFAAPQYRLVEGQHYPRSQLSPGRQ